MKATNSGEPCQRVVAVPGNYRVPNVKMGTARKSLGGKAERNVWRASISLSGLTEGRAAWHSCLGRRAGESFFASIPGLQASQYRRRSCVDSPRRKSLGREGLLLRSGVG
jgi:hypothetical protein